MRLKEHNGWFAVVDEDGYVCAVFTNAVEAAQWATGKMELKLGFGNEINPKIEKTPEVGDAGNFGHGQKLH